MIPLNNNTKKEEEKFMNETLKEIKDEIEELETARATFGELRINLMVN